MAINTLFQNIADAIRERAGTSGLITPAGMPQAIMDIPGGNDYLYGETDPAASLGENGQIYFKCAFEGGGEIDSGLGWYSSIAAICDNTNTIATIQARTYYKINSYPALAAVNRPGGTYWQVSYASTVPEACANRTSNGGDNTWQYTYVIDGVTWYFAPGNYGYSGSPAIVSDYPILDTAYSLSTQESAEAFLDVLGVTYTEPPYNPLIKDIFVKVNGNWTDNIIGLHLQDILGG